ncbi:glutathione binding-like protein [Altererythrobacter lutimaris]|uniref:Glutathione S-transferase N-terminal domain-containing protein n=1 Tax=Altererythrobacter lutimaris TaxID=2743979 RepID=A0A850H6N5_9SPHN|nr:glutathione binding-like protein [Altererythrobacter lutimaris]NVE93493.1 glutathione S-transferase N-terminal domain-containing protein [Altererythrobacter lutimaris]
MIDFYFWPTPNGHKISIALEEFELDYVTQPINILTGEQHAPDFIAISPNNRVPAIVDYDGPDGRPHTVFESGAILLYLAQKTGKFWPDDPVQRSIITQWVFFQCANIGPMFGQCGHFRGYAAEEVPYAIERYSGETKRLYGLIDRELAKKPWIAGDEYSLADMATYPWMDARQQKLHGIDISAFPNVAAWIEKCETRPGVQRGMALLKTDMKVGDPTEETRKAFFFRE